MTSNVVPKRLFKRVDFPVDWEPSMATKLYWNPASLSPHRSIWAPRSSLTHECSPQLLTRLEKYNFDIRKLFFFVDNLNTLVRERGGTPHGGCVANGCVANGCGGNWKSGNWKSGKRVCMCLVSRWLPLGAHGGFMGAYLSHVTLLYGLKWTVWMVNLSA